MLLRYERKYLVPNNLMEIMRKRLIPFVNPDNFTSTNEKGVNEYTVRSIYFDSNDLISYNEKSDGIKFRRKFRIRGYNNCEENSSVVFEIKRKIENRIRKHRAFVYYHDVEKLLATGDVENYVIRDKKYEKGVEDAKRFFFHIYKYHFVPTVLVVYEREAYFGKFDPETRITFDKNIRSRTYTPINELYSNNNLKHLFDSHFILEIKYYKDDMPKWAKSLVQEFKLRHEALSKYTIGYDVNKHRCLQLY